MSETPKRLPKGVYVRRRIGVLFALIAVAAIIVALVAGPDRVMGWFGAGESSDASSEVAGSDAGGGSAGNNSGSASTPSEPTEPGPCDTSRLGVAAVTDKSSYGSDETPKLSMRVTNHNEVACDIDLGTETMAFVITSGSEVYWDSRHCQLDGEELLVRMEPGQSLETEPLEWNRTRSTPETCGDEERPAIPSGGSSYHLSAEIAGVQSGSTQQFLVY